MLEGEHIELDLKDPILKKKIVVPCLGDRCLHSNFFDRDVFVDAFALVSSRRAARGEVKAALA